MPSLFGVIDFLFSFRSVINLTLSWPVGHSLCSEATVFSTTNVENERIPHVSACALKRPRLVGVEPTGDTVLSHRITESAEAQYKSAHGQGEQRDRYI